MQQPLAAGVLKLGPQLSGLVSQPDVSRIVVAEPEDPAGTVRPAAAVANLSLLEQDDLAPTAGNCPGRRQAGDAAADHDDVRPHERLP